MNTVFFGSGPFAVPVLERLQALDGPHRLAAVVSRPARPAGRGRRLRPTPLALRAAELGLACATPRSVNDAAALAWLRELSPDLFVVADFGEFLRKPFRELPRVGAFNLHASLLPLFRGAAPVVHAILAGETRTGVTLFRIERELDSGPLLDAAGIAIREDETAGELEARLAELAADLLARNLERLAAGSFRETPQDASRATLAPRVRKDDGLIDWQADAGTIARRARAYNPWPGAFTFLAPAGRARERITLWRLRPADTGGAGAAAPPANDLAPGSVRSATADAFTIQCGRGAVEVLELQRAGKAPLPAAAFLRGLPLRRGDRFGG